MIHRSVSVVLAIVTILAFGICARADAPKEIKTEKNKTVFLGNFLNAPNTCGTNPGPVPLPTLLVKPANGVVGLQIVIADVAQTDVCAARKVPAIALFYTPSKDFVGKDAVQVGFETGDKKIPSLSFVISVEAPGDK